MITTRAPDGANKEIYLIQIYFDGLAVHKVKVIVADEVVHYPRH